MASSEAVELQQWTFGRADELQQLWPGATFRAIGPGAFSARVVRRTLPSVVIEGVTATPYAVQRGEEEIARMPRDDLLVHVLLDGRGVVTRAAEQCSVVAGDLFLLRIGTPYGYRCPTWTRSFRATVAEELLPPALREVYQPPLALLRPSAVTRAFLRLAKDLLTDDLALPRASAAHLDAAVVALEQGLLAEELTRRPARTDGSARLRADVLDHIERHLADRALSPGSLAARFGVSIRRLHQLFEPLPETAAQRIRRRRVEEAAAVLRVRNATAAELASSLGFRSTETFQRAFRLQQGMSPAEYRALRVSIVDDQEG
ncbi:helix-turn-helix domain-containing protein [Amnibacterium sp.]|uniref:helix-turn-helix domain-containing protein n=1 Tax=Amnibacterium sp. TaxID=1872496 RepID=UPI003F7C80F4